MPTNRGYLPPHRRPLLLGLLHLHRLLHLLLDLLLLMVDLLHRLSVLLDRRADRLLCGDGARHFP